MRMIALIAVLSLPLAACNQNNELAAPAVGEELVYDTGPSVQVASAGHNNDNDGESLWDRTRRSAHSMEESATSDSEIRLGRHALSKSDPRVIYAETLGGGFKPVLSSD